MTCPKCRAKQDRVINSRESVRGMAIRRRRVCLACGQRWSTIERHVPSPPDAPLRLAHRYIL